MTTDPNAPIYPCQPQDAQGGNIGPLECGLTVRAYFAGLVMQSVAGQSLNSPATIQALVKGTLTVSTAVSTIAEMSCLVADALIAELNK